MRPTRCEALEVLNSQAVAKKDAKQTTEVLASRFLGSHEGSEFLAEVLFCAACNFDKFTHLGQGWLAEIAWYLTEKTLHVHPDTGRKDSAFRRVLLCLCQHLFEDLLSKDYSAATLPQARSTSRFIGELHLKNLLSAKVFKRVLIDLLATKGGFFGIRFRIECLHAILKVSGQAFAEREASFLVSIVAQMEELAGKALRLGLGRNWQKRHGCSLEQSAKFQERIKRLIVEIQDMSSQWQPKLILTVHACNAAVCDSGISCTNVAGEEMCSLDAIAGLTCSEFVTEVTNQLKVPFQKLAFVLPSGSLLPLVECDDCMLSELICNA